MPVSSLVSKMLKNISNRLKLFSAVLVAASFITVPAHAQIAVKPLAMGTPGGHVLNREDQYCKSFVIKKSGADWIVAENADLKDGNVEALSGCLGYTAEPSIDAVYFSVATQSTCKTETRCLAPIVGPINTRCTNRDVFLSRSPRSTGYFSCNSNFANRNFIGGLRFDEPISKELLSAALSSESIRAAAIEFANAQYRRVLASAVQGGASACGLCRSERDAIHDLFSYFAAFATPDELNSAASNYMVMTGARQVPEWMKAHLSPSTATLVVAQGEQEWRRKYAEKTKQLAAPGSSSEDLRKFINQLGRQDPNNWGSVDFDGQLPQLQQLLQNRLAQQKNEADRLAQQAAQEAERRRQIEARKVAEWRKTLQTGTDTFCGTVIEVRAPMVRIALNVQLPGYSNEVWLKSSEVFPAQYGCRNVNGRLSIY